MFKPTAAEKSEEIKRILKRLVQDRGMPVLHISAFGYKYDSAFWIAVNTDAEREQLKGDADFVTRLHAVFEETGYSDMVEQIWHNEIKDPRLLYLKTPGIEFESQQTVDRDYGGNWFYAMK